VPATIQTVAPCPCPLCRALDAAEHYSEPERNYWRCSTCALVFLSPAQRLAYSDEVDRYRLHRNSEDDPAYLKFLSRLAEPMIARVSPGSSGLDYGCGPAPALALLFSSSGRPTASYDPIFHPVEPLLRARYDFVTCSEVLEHAHDPLRLFRRLQRLVVNGGNIGVMTRWYDDRTQFAKWHYRRDPTHVCFFNEHTMHWVADHFGWRLSVPAIDIAIFTIGASGGIR
jgi:SAM-dependent methyltransferase